MVATWNIAADSGYYNREAASQRSSYYAAGNELPGRWYAPRGDFGLVDGAKVDAKVFQRLYAGLDENLKSLISNSRGRGADRVPAYDITFSVSGSVSLTEALAAAGLREQIEQAFDRAARAALGLLEREGTYARRGRAGERVERVALTAALFQHNESRPCAHSDGRVFGDPNLHLHCVVMNLATRADGSVGAVLSTIQRDLKLCLGAYMHAALAHELQALGFSIDRVGPNGTFEFAGVEESHIDYFSARRREIQDELKKHGVKSRDAAALAAAIAKSTRRAKDRATSERREQIWAQAARARGIDVDVFAENLRAANRVPAPEEAEKLLAEQLAELPRRLTEMQSVVERKDLLRAVAAALVGTGLPVSRIDSEVARLVETQAFVEIGRDRFDRPRYSTPEMMRIEREAVACATRLVARDGFTIDESEVRARCAEAHLSQEQTAAAVAMTSACAIAAVIGAPGAGKSTTLAPVVAEYRKSGRRVIGAAAAWRTAIALGDDLSIESRAIAALLENVRRGGKFLGAGDILVVDEAGLVNTRDMCTLLEVVDRVGAKVILIGDPKQLRAIGGPGLSLVQRAIEAARVDAIVRQHDQWQRDAIRAFGNGRAKEALSAYAEHNHIIEVAGQAAAVDAIVGRWRETRTSDTAHEPLLLARTNAEVAAISRAVREVLRAEGAIKGPEVEFAAATPSGQTTAIRLAEGDRIRFLVRNDSLRVINGTTAVVAGVSHEPTIDSDEDGKIRIEANVSGRHVTFTPDDLTDNKGRARLGWAYATTVYQAQGVTVDDAIVVVDPSFDRHQIYVAASRARKSTTLVVDGGIIDRLMTAELPLDRQRQATAFSSEERREWLAKRLSLANVQETTLDVADAEAAREVNCVSSAPREARGRRDQSREVSLG